MLIDDLHRKARDTIDALYSYTNVPRSVTKAKLESLRDEIEGLLETLRDVESDDEA